MHRKLVYAPINEGNPSGYGYGLNAAWKLYYNAIKGAHPDALIAGPNEPQYYVNTIYNFLVYAKQNYCVPDVITWHELESSDLPWIYDNVQRVRNWIARLEDAKVYGCLPFWH